MMRSFREVFSYTLKSPGPCQKSELGFRIVTQLNAAVNNHFHICSLLILVLAPLEIYDWGIPVEALKFKIAEYNDFFFLRPAVHVHDSRPEDAVTDPGDETR
jgi:hypothetical protein